MVASPDEAFKAWCDFLGPIEGGLSMDPNDPGNWTGGKVGLGRLVGTKYGIAASSHPNVDIPNLTLDQANALRKTEYWDAIGGDELHPSVAFVMAEAAYGSWVVVARKTLQATLGVTQDGVVGPLTKGALAGLISSPSQLGLTSGLDDFLTEFSSRRLLFEASLGNWHDAEGGWTRRLFRGLLVAKRLAT